MTTKYTDAPRTRVMTPASLNNGTHENHSIGQTMAIAPKKGLFDAISIPQIIAGAAAAATSVALASKIGIAGSVIGAAVSSVITVVSSQIYRHFISASAEALKGTHAAVDYPAGAYEPVELNAEEHLGGAATTQEMRQVAGRATTTRVAPNSLRAKAAEERSQTQKKVIIFSIAIVAVIACAGAILITTAGEGLGERPEPILSSRTTESDANDNTQSQDQQTQTDDTQDSSTSANSSSNTQDQSQGTDSSTANSGTPSGTTDSSQTTDGSQPSTGGQTSDTTSGTGTAGSSNSNSSDTTSGMTSNSSSQGTTSGN